MVINEITQNGSIMEPMKKVVHIIPLGYEFDCAVAPFSVWHVDKVILVVNKDDAFQVHFTKMVCEYLGNRGIEVCVESPLSMDLHDVGALLSSLTHRELSLGNTVSLNIAACDWFVTIAADNVSRVYKVFEYGVVPDSFASSNEEILEHGYGVCCIESPHISVVDNCMVRMISDEQALVLELLSVYSDVGHEWVSHSEVANVLHEFYPEKYVWDSQGRRVCPFKRGCKEHDVYRDEQRRFSSYFHATFVRVLESEYGYIEENPAGGKTKLYRVTDAGRCALIVHTVSGRVRVVGGNVVFVHEDGSMRVVLKGKLV